MPNAKGPPKPELTDAEIARLGRIARDDEREEWLRERTRSRLDRIKSWATWITAIWAAKSLLWPSIAEAIDHFKAHWR